MATPSRGITVIEVLIVIGIIAILIGLVLPVVNGARENARRIQCESKLRQIGMAVAAYETTHRYMPIGRMSPDWVVGGEVISDHTFYPRGMLDAPNSVTGYRSVHTFLLPHLGYRNAYLQLDFTLPLFQQLSELAGDGERPINPNFPVWAEVGGFFLCPSEYKVSRRITDNNYRYNFGGDMHYAGGVDPTHNDTHHAIVSGTRLDMRGNGAFTIGRKLRISDIQDGMTNTAFFTERITGDGLGGDEGPLGQGDILGITFKTDSPITREHLFDRCSLKVPDDDPVPRTVFRSAGRWLGGDQASHGWPFAFYSSAMYNHVAPPNWMSSDCTQYSNAPDVPGEHAIISARSYHGGGVNVVYGDGHTQFVSDEIDLITWRALGTRAGSEQSKIR